MLTEPQIRSALMTAIQAADNKARVYRRWRYPAENRLAEWAALFRDVDRKLNCYWIRRVRRFPTIKGTPGRLAKVELVYEIRFYFGLFDSNDDAAASEEIAQARVDTLAAQLEADVTLGLGRCVGHGGLELPNDFEDVLIGDWPAHRAVMRLSVEVANVNC